MNSDTIDKLLEKYFAGETTLEEEKKLKVYFSSPKIAQKHLNYRKLFTFIQNELEISEFKHKPVQRFFLKARTLAIAACIGGVVAIAVTYYIGQQSQSSKDLGTFDDPEVAFRETQKALNLLSLKLNTGIESVQYLNEYEKSRKVVFKN